MLEIIVQWLLIYSGRIKKIRSRFNFFNAEISLEISVDKYTNEYILNVCHIWNYEAYTKKSIIIKLLKFDIISKDK